MINYTGDGVSGEEVRKVYNKWLHLPNGEEDAIDFIFGTVICNRLQDVPAWGILEAASGFIKSTLLQSIEEAKGIHAEDNLSSAGLVSGFRESGKNSMSIDPSLLAVLDGKVYAVKDITSILSNRTEEVCKTFGTLRSVFDGKYVHRFGNLVRTYKVKFGMVCGATEVIKKFLAEQGHLGERFYVLTLNLPEHKEDERKYIKRAITNSNDANKMNEELKEIANKCLNFDFLNKLKPVIIPEKIEDKLSYLALYVSLLRGKVDINKYTKEIMYNAVRELGTRIAKQFLKLLKGICYFRRIEIATNNEYKIIKRCAISTVNTNLEMIVRGCYKNGFTGVYTSESLSKLKNIKLSPMVCEMSANSLYMLEVFDRIPLKFSKFEYTLNEEFIQIIKNSEVYK